MNFLDYFFDPILRGPTLGSLFMSFTTSLVGVIVFLRKKCLLGECVSHATYPGLIIGLLLGAQLETDSPLLPLTGAACFGWLSMKAVTHLSKTWNVKNDTALAAVLSTFFGFGVLLVSGLQNSYGALYKKGESLLLGQTATMRDSHIYLFLTFFLITALFFIAFSKEMKATLFDPSFAKISGISVRKLEWAFEIFSLVAIVVGIRSSGVVLVSSLLVAPPLIAFLLTTRLSRMYILAVVVGGLSSLLGTVTSNECSKFFSKNSLHGHIVFPTGPTIALFLSFFALLTLFFSPRKGLFFKTYNILNFKSKCLQENILKLLWRFQPKGLTRKEIRERFPLSFIFIHLALRTLKKEGWILKHKGKWLLTTDGLSRGARIVRLHRLWELYLVDVVGKEKEEVHFTADEMEHILTPELESRLDTILQKPALDPHNQPIPRLK